MSHHLSATATASRDAKLARRIRLEEVVDGWEGARNAHVPAADIATDIMGSDDVGTLTSDDHPELGDLGALSWADLESALIAEIERQRA